MRVLILGCGYVGLSLGSELVRRGHDVFGVRRSPESKTQLEAAGIRSLIADITQKEALAALPGPFDWVVNLASSGRGGVEEYQRVYLEGTHRVLDWLAASPPRKYVYTSSTSVYGQNDGTQVKETSPTEPDSPTARVLVETERLLIDANREGKFPSIILRVSGIYGPERTHYLNQFVANETQIRGKGERYLNMIHLDDLVGVLGAALKDGRAGEVYNATDDEPVMEIHFFRWLSETLGKWMPPFAPEPESSGGKRGTSNKKVLNRKLKMELGYRLVHPTFRQGYTAEIQRLERAGRLNITLDPRD